MGLLCSLLCVCVCVVIRLQAARCWVKGGGLTKLWERKASRRCHIHQCNASRCVKRLRVHTSVHTSSLTIMCNKHTFAPKHAPAHFHRMTMIFQGGQSKMCEISRCVKFPLCRQCKYFTLSAFSKVMVLLVECCSDVEGCKD